MNLLSSVSNTQHDHPGQKILEYLAQLQQHNALLKESLALSQKTLAQSHEALALSQKENALQQELIAKLQAQDVQQYVGVTFLSHDAWKACMTDRLSGTGLFPRLGEVIEEASYVCCRVACQK